MGKHLVVNFFIESLRGRGIFPGQPITNLYSQIILPSQRPYFNKLFIQTRWEGVGYFNRPPLCFVMVATHNLHYLASVSPRNEPVFQRGTAELASFLRRSQGSVVAQEPLIESIYYRLRLSTSIVHSLYYSALALSLSSMLYCNYVKTIGTPFR